MSLRTQRIPYTGSTLTEFDPNLGRHDGFLLLGPYIFAQKTDSNVISLYVSYNRQPFQRAMIPATDPHRVRCVCQFGVPVTLSASVSELYSVPHR